MTLVSAPTTEPVFTRMYLGCADPEISWTPAVRHAMLVLHTLLLPTPIIQDNFFISRRLRAVSERYDILVPLIKAGVIQVAFREGVEKDLLEILDKYFLKGRSRPFAGDQLRHYKDKAHVDYLRKVQRSIGGSDQYLTEWKDQYLGTQYKERLRKAIDTHESELGLSKAQRSDAFEAVERRALAGGRHNCTAYWDYADDPKLSPPELGPKIKAWSRLHYLQNLPKEMGFGTSIPLEGVTREPGHLQETLRDLETRRSRFGDSKLGDLIRSGLMNPSVLQSLQAQDVLRLRDSEEFEALSKAWNSKRPDRITTALLSYSSFVHGYVAARKTPLAGRITFLGHIAGGLSLAGRWGGAPGAEEGEEIVRKRVSKDLTLSALWLEKTAYTGDLASSVEFAQAIDTSGFSNRSEGLL